MTREEVFGKVSKILAEDFEIPGEQIKEAAHLYEELGLDSLDSIDLVIALENEFQFKVDREKDEESLKKMRVVTDICEFIESKLA